MLARAVEIARLEARGMTVPNVILTPEKKVHPLAKNPEELLAKIFRLHRDGPFNALVEDPRCVEIGRELIEPDIVCFDSQFIFKNCHAMGQPWHQDAFYFAFSKSLQVGFWLAITRATLENGWLRVLPGSHTKPVHRHVPDPRTYALNGYAEIVDYDTSRSIPLLLDAGDLLVFHGHLMHRSTDNVSDCIRAAFVWHYSSARTQDLTLYNFGFQNDTHDFMPIARNTAERVPRF